MVIGTDADLRCWVEQFRDLKPLTPCMPCSFSAGKPPRSEAGAQRNHPVWVTVVDRQIPLLTAAYGTRVARPARTTRIASGGGDGSPLGKTVRPVLGDHGVVGKSRRAHGRLRTKPVTGPSLLPA